ncbi:hypothetical protein FA95DRAFT_1551978 [Auriscalpium vulgare]|uniref:Uncharacterized protein n=1 Tax=Auriscalpium vulgare TaxID=40419 RepID=A0ACB8SD81_9AGAM|nr:hypothetical protein FA95DRAFT_1551978 [Auriscalpium vulgare]
MPARRCVRLRRQRPDVSSTPTQEQEQLEALRTKSAADAEQAKSEAARQDRDFEAGFGGQEDLEDRYATTSGEN